MLGLFLLLGTLLMSDTLQSVIEKRRDELDRLQKERPKEWLTCFEDDFNAFLDQRVLSTVKVFHKHAKK